MKQRLVKGFLVLALLCFLPGMMFCKGQPVQANPGDSEEEQEEEKSEDTDTGELEQKRQNALDQIKSIKSDIDVYKRQRQQFFLFIQLFFIFILLSGSRSNLALIICNFSGFGRHSRIYCFFLFLHLRQHILQLLSGRLQLSLIHIYKGIDIGAASGSAIVAAASGRVTTAAYSSSAGNYVVISHGNGVSTVYMHASALYVAEGAAVSAGDTIAAVSYTHLIRNQGLSHCGRPFLNPAVL